MAGVLASKVRRNRREVREERRGERREEEENIPGQVKKGNKLGLSKWDKCTYSNWEDLNYTLTINIFNILALYVVSYTP